MNNILKGWQVKSLGEVVEVIAGQSPPSSTYNNIQDGLPFFQGKIDFGIMFPKVRVWCNDPVKIAKPNDILISVRAPVGPTNICDVKSCIGRGLSAIRAKGNSFYKYIFYFLRSIENRISNQGRGSTFNAITQSELREIKIPLPPLPIQKQIAEILEQADKAKQKRKEANKLTDEFLQSVFIEMFGDPVKNPKGWEITTIMGLAKKDKNAIKAGPFGSSLKKECYVEKGFKIYGQEQIIRDDLQYGDYFISKDKYEELNNYAVQGGDILISLVGTYGKISIVPERYEQGIINPRLMKVSLNQTLMLPVFFKYYFQNTSFQKMVSNFSHGGTMDIVNIGILKALPFIAPPLTLQQRFAEIVNKTEALKEKQKQSEQELENLFQSLMQKAFKGELVS
jgi:type I restriction enzyme S subunit